MSKRRQVPIVPRSGNREQDRFNDAVRGRAEDDDGQHDPWNKRLTLKELRDALIEAGVANAENIAP